MLLERRWPGGGKMCTASAHTDFQHAMGAICATDPFDEKKPKMYANGARGSPMDYL